MLIALCISIAALVPAPAYPRVARAAVPVHFGTLWPIGLDRVRPDEFLLPGRRFAELAGQRAPVAEVRELVPGQTVRFELPEPVG